MVELPALMVELGSIMVELGSIMVELPDPKTSSGFIAGT
jgi:hypothetical protein